MLRKKNFQKYYKKASLRNVFLRYDVAE